MPGGDAATLTWLACLSLTFVTLFASHFCDLGVPSVRAINSGRLYVSIVANLFRANGPCRRLYLVWRCDLHLREWQSEVDGCAQVTPPWATIIALMIASPRPLPPLEVARERSTR